jgi:hypothetical protein
LDPTEDTVSEQFLCCYKGVFTSPLHRNGRHSIVECRHYLPTAVSLAPQFLFEEIRHTTADTYDIVTCRGMRDEMTGYSSDDWIY